MTLQYACQPFTTPAAVRAATCGCNYTADDDQMLLAIIDIVSDILALLSGLRVHGICTRTVRPVTDRYCWTAYSSITPVWNGSYYSDLRYYSGPSWLQGTFPLRGPNTDIVQILIDGAVFPQASYGLIEFEGQKYLQRTDGQSWPVVNDLRRDETQTGTWAVIYRFGYAPDWLTQRAAIELACQWAAEITTGASDLPPGITQANIQGAAMTLEDRAQTLRDGVNESLPFVSRFQGIYAPDGNMTRSGVWSPELNLGVDLVEVEGPSGS